MGHIHRKNRRRKTRGRQKSAGLAAMSLLSLSLSGAAAASDRSFFIFDQEASRMPGFRVAQAKRGGGRSGIRSGIRAGARGSGLRRGGALKGRAGRASGRSGYMKAAPTGTVPALDAGAKDATKTKK